MTTHEDLVTNPLYWNWVKGGLGLKYLTEGLESFVDDTLKSVQTGFLDDIRRNYIPGLHEDDEVKCTDCTTANALPCPTSGMCRRRGGICNYHDQTDELKKSKPCPNSICDKIVQKISLQHRHSNPSWKSTNAQNWCTNHFEIGKCFISIKGYEDMTATSQTDSSGMLHMAMNCLLIQNRLDVMINPPNDILSKLLNTRNSIFHSASCTLTKEQLDSYIVEMVTLLEDKKTLLANPKAKTAVLKLNKLKNGSFSISPKDELDVRNEALRAIEEKKNEAIHEIENKQDEVIDLINDTNETKHAKMSEEMSSNAKTMADQCDELRSSIQTLKLTQGTLEGNIENHEQRLKAMEQTFIHLKTSQEQTETTLATLLKDYTDFKKDMKATKTVEKQHQNRIEYLKRKQKLQTKLCEMYQSHIESIPLSPVLDGLDARVDDLFVELVICDDKIHEPKSTGNKIKGYEDIFVRTTNECKNKCKHVRNFDCEKEKRECKCKNMYVIGDAGMGKTTWCMKMLSTWIGALMNEDLITNALGNFSDENIMSKIDLLFFVSLRHAVNDGAIIDMITHQLFEEFPEMDSIVKEVLNTEPHKCLIILDGLDEWHPPKDFKAGSSSHHPGLPGKQGLHGCPVLTTTRPWKLNEVGLSKPDVDRAVKIQGIKDTNLFIEKIVGLLNENVTSQADHKNHKKFVSALHDAFKIQTHLECHTEDDSNDSYAQDDYADNEYGYFDNETPADKFFVHDDDDNDDSYSQDDYADNEYGYFDNETPADKFFVHDDDDNDDSYAQDDYADNEYGYFDNETHADKFFVHDDDNDDYGDDYWDDSSRFVHAGYVDASFHQIPLILMFMIHMWFDEDKLENTWAANFIGLIEYLVRIAERSIYERRPGRLSVKDNLQGLKASWSTASRFLPECIRLKTRLKNYSELLSKLAKLAFESLFNNSLVFTEDSLEDKLNHEELDVALKIGIISQSKVVGKMLKRETSLSFLHKSIQEFFSALYLVLKTENDDNKALERYIRYCQKPEDITEMANVLLFVCGMDPHIASEMSRHVANVTFHAFNKLLPFKVKCLQEMQRAHGPLYPSIECPIFTYDMTMEFEQYNDEAFLLIKTNSKNLISFDLTSSTNFILTKLNLESLNGIIVGELPLEMLDLSQLRQLQVLNLLNLNWNCIVKLDGSALKNILMLKCSNIQIKVSTNRQITNKTMSKSACEVKYIDLTHCGLSVEHEICSLGNVTFQHCESCKFTMKVSDVTHEATKIDTGKKYRIHSLVIDNSTELTLDINSVVEVEKLQIVGHPVPCRIPISELLDDVRFGLLLPRYEYSVENYTRQVPGFKQLNVQNCYPSSSTLPPQLEEITIPCSTKWIEKIRNHPNIACIRIHGCAKLVTRLPNLATLNSIKTQGTVETEVLQMLAHSCIERLEFRLNGRPQEILLTFDFLIQIQSLQYLKINVEITNCQYLGRAFLQMPKLKELSIECIKPESGVIVNEDEVSIGEQQIQKNVQELLLERLSFDTSGEGYILPYLLSSEMVHYLQHCSHLKDLSCNIFVLNQLVSRPELRPILSQVETFKRNAKEAFWNDSVESIINKMSNIRYIDLETIYLYDLNKVQGLFTNLEHLELLKLDCRARFRYLCNKFFDNVVSNGPISSHGFISQEFVDSLPATKKPITLEMSFCRIDYAVEQYLRSRHWLQSIERTVTLRTVNKSFKEVHNTKIVLWKNV